MAEKNSESSFPKQVTGNSKVAFYPWRPEVSAALSFLSPLDKSLDCESTAVCGG